METARGGVGYLGDTEIVRPLWKAHRGARLLIVPATRPRGNGILHHGTLEEAVDLVRDLRPELVLLTHFGMRMLEAGPEEEARWFGEATGTRCVAGCDHMRVVLGDGIEVIAPPPGIDPPVDRVKGGQREAGGEDGAQEGPAHVGHHAKGEPDTSPWGRGCSWRKIR